MRAAAVFLVLVLSAAGAAAQPDPGEDATDAADPITPPPTPVSTFELRYELWLDASITGACMAWWITSEILKSQLAPEECRWCNPPGIDRDVHDGLAWSSLGTPDTVSYITALAMSPLFVFGLDLLAAYNEGVTRAAWVDLLLIAEATSIAMAMNQTVKFLVGRQRPLVRFPPPEGVEHPVSDRNLSFYSGHTTFVFAIAVSAGTIASMRGYRLTPWIWTTGLAIAVATAYLRIAADRHYFSDVIVGALAGTATGFAIPYFFHGRLEGPAPVVAPAPTEGGAMLTATWRM